MDDNRDYEMMVKRCQYKGDGSVWRYYIDLSFIEIVCYHQSDNEISSTVEDSHSTNNIAEMNMNMVKSISNINNVISRDIR